ncbi:MAG: class I SAM-dependent methyltransferase [Candidatus Peribacteraceae bacterium]|jgi:hypothetical protein
MSFDRVFVSTLPGWLTGKESFLLYTLAQRCKGKGAIVEIGSWKGKSTVCLAQGSRDGTGGKVHAIDPFTGSSEHGQVYTFPEFRENIRRGGVEEWVVPVPKTSEAAHEGWNQPVELLWVDGAHEFEWVDLDFRLWSPHLVPGGVIAFHDSTDPGVWPVIDRELFLGKDFKRIRFLHGITYAVKGKPFPFANRGMMLLRDIKYAIWKLRDRYRKRRKKALSRPAAGPGA